MSKLTDELRRIAADMNLAPEDPLDPVEEAADRIDKLEAALSEIARFEHPTPTSADIAGEMARRALGESS